MLHVTVAPIPTGTSAVLARRLVALACLAAATGCMPMTPAATPLDPQSRVWYWDAGGDPLVADVEAVLAKSTADDPLLKVCIDNFARGMEMQHQKEAEPAGPGEVDMVALFAQCIQGCSDAPSVATAPELGAKYAKLCQERGDAAAETYFYAKVRKQIDDSKTAADALDAHDALVLAEEYLGITEKRLGETPQLQQLRTDLAAAQAARQADFDKAQAFLDSGDITVLSAKIEAVRASQAQSQADFQSTGVETFQKIYEEKVLEEQQLLEEYTKLAVAAGVRAPAQ